jgi:Fe-S-cluster-containing hydrogenase component 2
MEIRKKITIDTGKCNACRTCELICSFHRMNGFNPSQSSVKVFRDDDKGVIEVLINTMCDGCPNEIQPLCAKFCSSGCLSFYDKSKYKLE